MFNFTISSWFITIGHIAKICGMLVMKSLVRVDSGLRSEIGHLLQCLVPAGIQQWQMLGNKEKGTQEATVLSRAPILPS